MGTLRTRIAGRHSPSPRRAGVMGVAMSAGRAGIVVVVVVDVLVVVVSPGTVGGGTVVVVVDVVVVVVDVDEDVLVDVVDGRVVVD